MSKSRYLSILALSAFVGLAACARDEGEGEVVEQDTSVVTTQEQDTVVTTTTVDTITEGEDEAPDTTPGDTTPGDTAAKNP